VLQGLEGFVHLLGLEGGHSRAEALLHGGLLVGIGGRSEAHQLLDLLPQPWTVQGRTDHQVDPESVPRAR
jgi:hypothetical protein